jgi:multicomponent Na+:H+ antiporter subunit F
MNIHSEALTLALNISFIIFGVAIILTFIRLTLGPSTPDRVISLEHISVLVMGIILLYATATNQRLLLYIALVVSLISFLGVVAFAFFVERRGTP